MKKNTLTRLASGYLFILSTALVSPSHGDVFKCESGGRITYQATPCQGGKKLVSSGSAPTAAPADASPEEVQTPAEIRAEITRLEQRNRQLRKQATKSSTAQQKYHDEAELLRASARGGSGCSQLRVDARGYDSLAIKYPSDPSFRAKAEAAYRQLQYECR